MLRSLGLLCIALVDLMPLLAGAAELRLGLALEPSSLDPHYHNYGGNRAFAPHLFEGLVRMDAQQKPMPGLARSWVALDDTTWEFRLRPGVLFHDGTPLTAEDVAYSLARVPDVPNNPSSFNLYLGTLNKVEVVDALTLRLHTAEPEPLLPVNLSAIAILSRKNGEGAPTESYNTGRAAIGTGPYRLISWNRGQSISLVRNDAYWGGVPDWERVQIRFIRVPAARVAALSAGDVDAIDRVPVGDVARITEDPRFRITENPSPDAIGFMLDVTDRVPPGITASDGRLLTSNPLRNLKVRQAINLAIDRQAIVGRIMQGHAIATNQYMMPGEYGYSDRLPALRADPQGAHRLLAEAGFPDGFRLTLQCQNDRFVNDAAICQAVAQMLTRAGISAQPEVMPHAVWVGRANRREFSMFTYIWPLETGEPSGAFRNHLVTPTRMEDRSSNRGGYRNPALDALVQKATRTIDPAQREALLTEAADIGFSDVALLPLHRQVDVVAYSSRFRVPQRGGGHFRAMDVEPAP
ncbi:ABC transporter substrate-binding protein [Roseomonas elaeocarpi]|uniref:ABC transporter substrate-binding protein n=1 Tax=Roseomonas elaeocarpi TaxID=907779 RepID=A0ABV6JP54_9PROT